MQNMGKVTVEMCLAVCKHVHVHKASGARFTHWVQSGDKSSWAFLRAMLGQYDG